MRQSETIIVVNTYIQFYYIIIIFIWIKYIILTQIIEK
jgi:hypothetical protein